MFANAKSCWQALTRKKPAEGVNNEAKDATRGDGALKPVLSFMYVVLYGIAGMLGAGIFESPGEIINKLTGPAVIFSFLIAAIACALTGVCYADFAAKYPAAGGSYAYVYSALGEYFAFIAGIGNTFEYAIAGAAVARSWSSYLQALSKPLKDFEAGFVRYVLGYEPGKNDILIPDIYAPIISVLMVGVCLLGVKQSSRLSSLLTVVNVSSIFFVIAVGAFYIDPVNYTKFPESVVSGVFQGSIKSIFSFIGWDTVCVLSEEVKEPRKTIPRAIFTVLAVTSVVYGVLLVVMSGMKPYFEIDEKAGFSNVFPEGHFARTMISVLVLMCATNTTYASVQGQPRIWLSMARDGLLPARFSQVNKSNTPAFAIVCTGILITAVSFLFNFSLISDVTTLAVLFVQGLVCLGCLIGRVPPQVYASKKTIIKTSLTLLIFFVALGAAFYSTESDSFPRLFVILSSVLLGLCVLAATLVVYVSETTATVVPVIALLANFFMVGGLGFLKLGVLLAIMAGLSVGYFAYGVRYSKLRV